MLLRHPTPRLQNIRLLVITPKHRFTTPHIPNKATTPRLHSTTLPLLIIPLRPRSTTQRRRPNTTLLLMLLQLTTLKLQSSIRPQV
ncbi:Uncharacterized protein APZ42_000817, partial [Daphnia magna]